MGSGFKDFAAGDVLTANDVDGYLMRQTVMTFADASARDTALSGVLDEGMMAYLEDSNLTTFYDGSNWRQQNGRVLQVVHAGTETPVSNATGTYADSGLTATITPTSTSNKVLAIISQPFYLPNNCFMYFRVMSGATQVFVDSDLFYDAGQVQRFFVSYSELLTPATTSAHTVKTQFHSAASGTITAQTGAARSTITLMEIAG